jgi:NO-binding membrane sensor protein with MHYT domain
MIGMHALAVNGSVNYNAVIIVPGVVIIVGAVIAVIVASYFRAQGHRADAVAMAHYRKLAEEAVANQQELRDQLAKLTEKVQAVEQLMREVG